jgi:hypothetical protein
MHAFLNKGLAVCYRATAANRLSSSRRSKLAAAAPRSNAAAMGGPGRQAGRHAAAAAAYDDPQCPSVSKRRQLRPAAASAAHLIRCQVGRLSIAAARIMRRRQRRPPLHPPRRSMAVATTRAHRSAHTRLGLIARGLRQPCCASTSTLLPRSAGPGLWSPPPLPAGCVPPPARTADPAEALRLLRRDGQCLYQVLSSAAAEAAGAEKLRATALTLPARIFRPSLARFKPPERIAGGGWDGKAWRGYLVTGPDRGHLPNAPHMDGGELKSDYFMLFFAEVPEQGGRSYLLDGSAILSSLPAQIWVWPSSPKCLAAVDGKQRVT